MKGCLFMFISPWCLKRVRSFCSDVLKRRDFFNNSSLLPYVVYHVFSYISNIFNIAYDEDERLTFDLSHHKDLTHSMQEVTR